jgi:hypothetical protein
MLDLLTFAYDVFSRTIAGVIAPLILSGLTALALYFRRWVRENLRPLLVGVLSGSILGASIASIFFAKPPPQCTSASPKRIFEWYWAFPTRFDAEENAEKVYYGKYVEWELVFKRYREALTVESNPDPDLTPTVFCTFREKKPELRESVKYFNFSDINP